MTKAAINEQEPWYANPWVWLVIAIPGLTVAGCLLTIYLALANPHILVSDGPLPADTQADTAGNPDADRR